MKRSLSIFLACVLLSCMLAGSATGGGGADDPLISLSYITDTLLPALYEKAEAIISEKLLPVYNDLSRRLNAAGGSTTDMSYAAHFSPLSFSSGGTVKMTAFTSFILTSGTATLSVSAGEVVNISQGTVVKSGSVLTQGERYFATEDASATVTVYSDSAKGMVDGYYSASASGSLPADTQFIDVENHWAKEYILYLAERGIVNGVGNYRFNPEGVVNRGMFVTILGRVAGIDTAAYTSSPFTDVSGSEWYGPYVAWAAENGIVNGFGDGRFGPTSSITREQMAVITIRFAEYLGVTLPETEAPISFDDADSISSYAVDSVVKAQLTGLLNGKTATTFDPRGTAKRAEVCTIVYRFIQKAGLQF